MAIRALLILRSIAYTVSALALSLMLFALAIILREPRSSASMHYVAQFALPPSHGWLGGTDYAKIVGHTLYIAYMSEGTLLASDTQAGRPKPLATGLDGLHGIAFAGDPLRGYVSVGGRNEVAMVNLQNGAVLATAKAGGDPDGIVFDGKDSVVYAGNAEGRSATVIRTQDGNASTTMPLGGEPEYPQVDETTGLVYQPLVDTSELVIVDPAAERVTARHAIAPCEHPSGAALDAADRLLFLGCRNRMLAVVNLDTFRVLQTLPINRFVDFIAFDPVLRRVYTAGSAGDMTVVQQVGQNRFAVLDTVQTRAGGHTLAIDPTTHKVYVVCAGIRGASVVVFEPVPKLPHEPS